MKKLKKYNYIIIILSMILIGSLLIKYGVDLEKNIRPVYSYKIKKDDNYEILLKPNNFYMTKTLPSGGYYVSNSVNSYMIDLQYYFSANKKANIESNYNIVANLVGTVKDKDNLDKEVWNRSFTLHDNTQNRQENIDKFGINEQVNIDYEYYKNLAHEFEKNYDITMDTVLKVRFNIYCNINLSKLNANNKEVEDYIELDIPITKTITEIKQNYQNEVSEDIKPNINHLKLYKSIFYVAGILCIVTSIILETIKFYKNKKTAEELYNYKIRRILKYYDNLFVTINNEPDLTNLKIFNISVLEDLIDVAEQCQCNINRFKNNLYVFVNNIVYVYTI